VLQRVGCLCLAVMMFPWHRDVVESTPCQKCVNVLIKLVDRNFPLLYCTDLMTVVEHKEPYNRAVGKDCITHTIFLVITPDHIIRASKLPGNLVSSLAR
jgi:hypothetical protein